MYVVKMKAKELYKNMESETKLYTLYTDLKSVYFFKFENHKSPTMHPKELLVLDYSYGVVV